MKREAFTEDDLKVFLAKGARIAGAVPVEGVVLRHGKARVAGTTSVTSSKFKSKLEARYGKQLDFDCLIGLIHGWAYEPVNFRLPGKKNWYKPDFAVWGQFGIRFVDTKGRNKSDERSLVKIKTAAGLNRWATFLQVRYLSGEWTERVIT